MKYNRLLLKVLAVSMIFILLLSGCQGKTQNEESSNNDVKGEKEVETESDKNSSDEQTKVNESDDTSDDTSENTPEENENEDSGEYKLVWQDEENIHPINVPYSVPNVTYNVPSYTINSDLSNVENMDRFVGFTDKQIQMIADNGFVVLPRNNNWSHLQMYTIYDENEYKRLPSFITVDSVMHLYHIFFDGTLKVVERDYLYDELIALTDSMLEKTLLLYSDSNFEAVQDDLKFNAIYFAIAKNLLTQEYGDLPEEIEALADEEIKNIEKSSGYLDSPLLGKKVDYSQYKVRGHYTEDEILEKYFKAMMWYGQIGLPLVEGEGEDVQLCVDETVRAMIMTYIAFMQNNSTNDIESWDTIYTPTNFYVGQSDDLNLYHYKDLILNVYGSEVDINDFRDESYYDALLEEAMKMPAPGIKNKITQQDVPTGKQFRFMGQRYTFDAEVMQELMEPFMRPIPSGLDVSSVLGSTRAKELLDTYYEPQSAWPEYEENFDRMKDKVSSIGEEDWKSNMYNGWLWTVASIQKSFEEVEGVPTFMKNTAWTDKSISSALGSYAELKHDTILYVKQPVAECGFPEAQYHHYVEPNVEVYSKLIWLTEYSKLNLKERGILSERFEGLADGMINLLTFLRECSIKELNNEVLSKEDQNELNFFGGVMDSLIYEVTHESGGAKLKCSGVIADIATCGNGCLEIGTGLPNEIYVVIKDGDGLYLARGAVYGYYEFYSDTRYNDDEWHEMLGVIKENLSEDEDYEFFSLEVGEPSPSLPEQPEWVYSFKSKEENNVILQEMEVNWE